MPPKWVPLVTAPNSILAENWAEILRNNGIPAIARRDAEPSFVGVGVIPVRVMVPKEREAEAKELFERIVGPWEED